VFNGEVQLQHSWWTCVQGQLSTAAGMCASSVLSCAAPSLIAGTFSWAAYLGCVAGNCGVAFAKALLCCACNGSAWCSWIFGNCSQGVAATSGGPTCTVWDPYTKKYVPCPPTHEGLRCSGQTVTDQQTLEVLCCLAVVNGVCKKPAQWLGPNQRNP
jgi:hypothetical protein